MRGGLSDFPTTHRHKTRTLVTSLLLRAWRAVAARSATARTMAAASERRLDVHSLGGDAAVAILAALGVDIGTHLQVAERG